MTRHRLGAAVSAALLAVALTGCGDDGADVRQLEDNGSATGTTGSGTGTGTGTGGETGTDTEEDTGTEPETGTDGDTETPTS